MQHVIVITRGTPWTVDQMATIAAAGTQLRDA
jgi:hypothetical protein